MDIHHSQKALAQLSGWPESGVDMDTMIVDAIDRQVRPLQCPLSRVHREIRCGLVRGIPAFADLGLLLDPFRGITPTFSATSALVTTRSGR